MAKFKIEITETFQKELIVEANTKEEAIEMIEKAYDNGNITLDYDNFIEKEVEYIDNMYGEELLEKFPQEEIWKKY